MRYIKLFLAMSEAELREERMELSDYIRSLNDLYVERGIFFELCESGTADDRLIDEAQYFSCFFTEMRNINCWKSSTGRWKRSAQKGRRRSSHILKWQETGRYRKKCVPS